MEEVDNKEALQDVPDEELMRQEVIQEDTDLYFLHHYLSEVFRKG
ncbi:MAG: hypothetical protein RSB29_01920 [Alistipes sp.]